MMVERERERMGFKQKIIAELKLTSIHKGINFKTKLTKIGAERKIITGRDFTDQGLLNDTAIKIYLFIRRT